LYCRYETVMKAKDALFNSLQDSEEQVVWLFGLAA